MRVLATQGCAHAELRGLGIVDGGGVGQRGPCFTGGVRRANGGTGASREPMGGSMGEPFGGL